MSLCCFVAMTGCSGPHGSIGVPSSDLPLYSLSGFTRSLVAATREFVGYSAAAQRAVAVNPETLAATESYAVTDATFEFAQKLPDGILLQASSRIAILSAGARRDFSLAGESSEWDVASSATAYAVTIGKSEQTQIIRSLGGGTWEETTLNPSFATHELTVPIWSADGRHLLLLNTSGRNWQFYSAASHSAALVAGRHCESFSSGAFAVTAAMFSESADRVLVGDAEGKVYSWKTANDGSCETTATAPSLNLAVGKRIHRITVAGAGIFWVSQEGGTFTRIKVGDAEIAVELQFAPACDYPLSILSLPSGDIAVPCLTNAERTDLGVAFKRAELGIFQPPQTSARATVALRPDLKGSYAVDTILGRLFFLEDGGFGHLTATDLQSGAVVAERDIFLEGLFARP